MSSFLTDTGLIVKRLDEIKSEREAKYKSEIDAGINIAPESVAGQQIGINSEREALLWELIEIIYNSRYPDKATGISLDNLVFINNLTRLESTYSTVTCRIFGTNGTIIPEGTFIVSVNGNSEARFLTTESKIISGGYADVEFRAEEKGAIQAPAGTLTIIETPIAGITSVTNSLDAEIGREIETDEQLRLRRKQFISRVGTATVNGILNALINVSEVLRVSVIENDSGLIDSDGRPPHSFESVVSGGVDEDIAETIFLSKAAGIRAYGSEQVIVEDSQGISHTIGFSRPTDIDVYLRITITPNNNPNEGTTYPDNGDEAVAEAVLNFANASYNLGQDIILSQFYTPINTIPGVFGILVEASYNGTIWQTANLEIGATELANFDSTRIEVIS